MIRIRHMLSRLYERMTESRHRPLGAKEIQTRVREAERRNWYRY